VPAISQLVVGAIATITLIVSCALAGWWLFFSPLAEPVAEAPRSDGYRRGTLRTVTAAILVYVVLGSCGIWDSSWHMRLGIAGTVADFWWPPHLLMYLSFGVLALIAFYAFARILGLDGGLRARFRAQPLLGAFFLISLYQMGSGPTDEIWHKMYGVDLTAWALPHLVIVALSAIAIATLIVLYRAAVPERTLLEEVILLLPFAVVLWNSMAIGVGDWEFTLYTGAVPPTNPLFERPAWSYIVAGLLPLPFVLGAAAALLDHRLPSIAVTAVVLAWSSAVWALVIALGSPAPLFATPIAYFVSALAADGWRLLRGPRVRPFETGLVIAVAYLSVTIPVTVWSTHIVDLGPADLLLAIGPSLAIGPLLYAAAAACGRALRAFPARVDAVETQVSFA
jgi:hypothetical protein